MTAMLWLTVILSVVMAVGTANAWERDVMPLAWVLGIATVLLLRIASRTTDSGDDAASPGDGLQ